MHRFRWRLALQARIRCESEVDYSFFLLRLILGFPDDDLEHELVWIRTFLELLGLDFLRLYFLPLKNS